MSDDKGKGGKSGKDNGPDEQPPTERTCATMQVHHRLLAEDGRYAEARERIEEAAFRAEMGMMAQRTGCIEIPVVVHVVHRNSTEDISQAQIDSQITVLTNDFRKRNADIAGVPAPFAALAADARISFKLATVDPNGNPTNGVTRKRTTSSGFNGDDKVKSSATGGTDAWPADRYLNIWVCHLTGGLLGYAQFPGGAAATDGVVCRHSAFGTVGTAAAPFNLGRTATHEVGHWLNLRHIWGDDGDGCGGSDFVADTPNQGGPNTGTPTFPKTSCSNGPNGDMFMNYMDYTDDVGMFMFTAGQVARMQACLDGPRSTIGRSVPCGIVKLPIKDIAKEPIKDPIKDAPKDGIKDFPKDRPKDIPKDIVKEPVKDLPKDGSKDFPKDRPKEFAKETPKDRPKEFTKEFPKETIKERPKDFIKDRPKEAVLDPQKPPFGEDPKGLVEQPGGFGGVVINPQINPGINPAIGAQPFVLGGVGQRPDEGGQDGLGNAYAMILSGFAQLAQSGLLDESGQAVYAQLAASYEAMLGGQ
jgi:Pregnancy-associated plasma protein-A